MSGCKAIKGIPKSKEPLYEERKHTNGFTFDRAWEKEVTAIKEGKKKKSDKIVINSLRPM